MEICYNVEAYNEFKHTLEHKNRRFFSLKTTLYGKSKQHQSVPGKPSSQHNLSSQHQNVPRSFLKRSERMHSVYNRHFSAALQGHTHPSTRVAAFHTTTDRVKLQYQPLFTGLMVLVLRTWKQLSRPPVTFNVVHYQTARRMSKAFCFTAVLLSLFSDSQHKTAADPALTLGETEQTMQTLDDDVRGRAALRQKQATSEVWSQAELINSLKHLSHPPLNFTGVNKSEIYPQSSTAVALYLRKGATYLKSNRCFGMRH